MDPLTERSLPQPREPDYVKPMAAYETALGKMSTDQLLAELTRINSLASTRAQSSVDDLLARKLESESQVHASSPRTEPQYRAPVDRGRPTSQSRPPSPLELLANSSRISQRLAGKLTLASARATARKR